MVKLIEGLTGERSIYKRRGEREPDVSKTIILWMTKSFYDTHHDFGLVTFSVPVFSSTPSKFSPHVFDWWWMSVAACTGSMAMMAD